MIYSALLFNANFFPLGLAPVVSIGQSSLSKLDVRAKSSDEDRTSVAVVSRMLN